MSELLTSDPNTGHGHVFPRPDGVKARCGGPGICSECARDLARKQHEASNAKDIARTSKERVGPHISRSCIGCKYLDGKSYRVQGDSGVDYNCLHPQRAGMIIYIGDSRCETPDWCPANAPETNSCGVKCAHCDGRGHFESFYNQERGWQDEGPCITCGGSGRILTVEQYLKTLPANWHEDSSLHTWFPLTAEAHDRYKRCLYRANGRLIQMGQEPEKLDYPERPELKASEGRS